MARRTAAAIALGRRELPLAEELARLCLEGSDEGDPSCGPALELLVAIQLARGDREGARQTLAVLTSLANARPSPSLSLNALSELATGQVVNADGGEEAIAHLNRAGHEFAALQLPFEAARARFAAGQGSRFRQPAGRNS